MCTGGGKGWRVVSRGRGGSSIVGRQRVEVIQEMLLTDSYPLYRISLLWHSNVPSDFSKPNAFGSSENKALKNLPNPPITPSSCLVPKKPYSSCHGCGQMDLGSNQVCQLLPQEALTWVQRLGSGLSALQPCVPSNPASAIHQLSTEDQVLTSHFLIYKVMTIIISTIMLAKTCDIL